MDTTTAAVVLAGGEGKRMLSDDPQVLHKVADRPLVCHAVGAVLEQGWAPLVIVTNPHNEAGIREAVEKCFPSAKPVYCQQQAATGFLDAVAVGLTGLGAFNSNVLVLPANMPLLQPGTTLQCLESMVAEMGSSASAPYVGLVSRRAEQYFPVFCAGRSWLQEVLQMLRGQPSGNPASSAAAWIGDLRQGLPSAGPDSDSDMLAHFAARGVAVNAASEDDVCVVATRADLATAEALLQPRLIAAHQARGVTFRDPAGTFLGVDVVIGQDSTIGVGVQLYGATTLGRRVRLEGPSSVTDSTLEDGVYIRSFSVLEGARVGAGSGAGPFARLREGTELGPSSYLGNFVETKNARLGRNTLACHLAYLGDAEVGSRVNVGAGTITCNFDGVAKRRTTVGDGAFVGSNSTLVAPVTVGAGSVIAAGSVVTQEVPEGSLVFGRARQTVREDGAAPLKEKLKQRGS